VPGRILPLIAVLAAGLAAATAGCGGGGSSTSMTPPHGPGSGRPPVVIGSQGFTEQRILGELYTQALRAKGFRVRLKPALPNQVAADQALVDGQIDGYPEYIGAILETVAHNPRPPVAPGAAYRAVRAFEAGRGLTALAPTPFERATALATTAAYARAHRLTQIGGLARVGRFALGAAPDFGIRPSGLPAVRRAYGLAGVRFVPLSRGLQYPALNGGRVQAAAVLTTDPPLRRGRYAVLADPKRVFGVQNVVPVFSRAVIAAEGPVFTRTVEAVSTKLTSQAMRRMNAAVELDKRDPADVAHDFLHANGMT
jgi:osmoprotectant transport system substrate-binding protein